MKIVHGVWLNNLKLFFFPLAQIALLAINVKQVSQNHFFGAWLVSGAISLLSSHNIRRLVHASKWAPYVVAIGAATGTALGMVLAHWFYGE